MVNPRVVSSVDNYWVDYLTGEQFSIKRRE